ncbi:hypothetical protein M772_07275, partial [Neisseria gonorrhoeae MU_NG3]
LISSRVVRRKRKEFGFIMIVRLNQNQPIMPNKEKKKLKTILIEVWEIPIVSFAKESNI